MIIGDSKMTSLYWRITDKCNLQCRHCAYSCGPDGKSVSVDDAKRIVDNFPRDLGFLLLGGGEPMFVRPLLGEILDYINSKGFPNLIMQLQSNGFWARDEESAKDGLDWLDEKKIRSVDFGSDDPYHAEQGINVNDINGKSIDKYLGQILPVNNNRDRVYFSKRGVPPGEIRPFGRGKNLSAADFCRFSFCLASGFLDGGFDVTIDPSGNAYLCCFQMPYPMGNAINTPLEEIAENAKKDKIFTTLSNGGLGEVAKEFGVLGDYDTNPCCKCEGLFTKLKDMGMLETRLEKSVEGAA
jgi:MoaA/NifB/PqqE/SkfB family radical SAM enzyme